MVTETETIEQSSTTRIGLVGVTLLVIILEFTGSAFERTDLAHKINLWANGFIEPNQMGLFMRHVLAWWTLAPMVLFGVVAIVVLRCTPRQVFLLPGNSTWSIPKTIVILLAVGICEVAIILTTQWANLTYALHLGDMAGNLFSNAYEELLYRSFMLGMLIRFSGRPWYAIFLTSLLFTLGHTQYMGWISLGFFVLAIPFGWITWKTKWILWPWILHMLVDLAVDPFFTQGHVSQVLGSD